MGKFNSLIGALSLLFVAGLCLPLRAEETVPAERPEKLYPDPHSVHLSVMDQNVPEFNRDDVVDWAALIREMQRVSPDVSLSPDIKMLLDVVTPTEMSDSDQNAVINELNGILRFWAEAERSKEIVQDDLGLRWRLRARLIGYLPSLASRQAGSELPAMTCLTCHSGEELQAGTYLKKQNLAPLNTETILDCVAKALAEGRKLEECEKLAETPIQADIEPYGGSRNYIQRKKKDTDISFHVGIQPEDPYTFKPLLKNLLCVECHSVGRKNNEIKKKDGTLKKVPLFYGLGAGVADSAQEATHLGGN